MNILTRFQKAGCRLAVGMEGLPFPSWSGSVEPLFINKNGNRERSSGLWCFSLMKRGFSSIESGLRFEFFNMTDEETEEDISRPPSSWGDLPHDILIVIFNKLCLRDLLSISMTCRSWHKACLNSHAFSGLDFRDWKTVSRVVRRRFRKLGSFSLSEDQIFDYVLSFAAGRSLGCETTIIYPNHHCVSHASDYVKLRCPDIKVFYLGDRGEYWHGRKVATCESIYYL